MTTSPWPVPDPDAPLAALRVLDLSSQLPGPYATSLLAGLGAAVVKIEAPGGDVGQRVDPAMYRRLNAQKTVIELDLKSEAGRARLHELVRDADVVMEAWRPGVALRLAADARTLAAINPRLLYCSLTGFGQDGPLSGIGAHDLNVQAAVGAVDADTASDRIGVAWVDLASGQAAALAITAHWQAGRSGFLDVAMLDVARSWASIKPEAVSTPEPAYGVVTTSDGHRFALTVLEDEVWQRLCSALGWSGWAADPAFARGDARRTAAPAIRSRLDRAIAQYDGPALTALARASDLPLTAIDPPDAAAAEQIALRERAGLLRDVAEPVPWPLVLPEPLTPEQQTAEPVTPRRHP